MSNVVQFKKKSLAEKHKGKGLCRSGFHKWAIDKEKVFDTKLGKLVTSYKCARCGIVKNNSI